MTTPTRTRCESLALLDALRFDDKPTTNDNAPAMTAAAQALDVPRSWIQVARLGAYEGHAAGGFAFTAAVFDKLVSNFYRSENRAVPLDFEHATEMMGCDGSIPGAGAPATGWIVALENRGKSGLWGLVEWLEPGLSYVRARRYRFFSPAVVFDATDPATGVKVGPVLVSGALTNRPFLDGMAEVTAKHGNEQQESTSMKPEEIIKVIALATGETDTTLENFGAKLTDQATRLRAAEAKVATFEAAEKAAEEKAANVDVDAAITAGLVANSPEARKGALDVRLSQPKVFAAMFSARLEAAKVKGAEKAAPTASSETVTQLTTRAVSGTGGSPPPAGALVGNNRSDVVVAKAKELAAKEPARFAVRGNASTPNADAFRQADKLVPAVTAN